MNIGVVTSYIIGGMMMLSIIAFNMNLNSSTQETTLSTITQHQLDDLVVYLSDDFKRIGYKDDDPEDPFDNPILTISDSEKIEFRTSTSGNSIVWYADPSDKATSTTNEDDYYLYREEGSTTYKFPVTHFELKYIKYDNNLNMWVEATDPNDARKVEVEIVIESGEPIRTNKSGQQLFYRTAWKKTFSPHNINKPW